MKILSFLFVFWSTFSFTAVLENIGIPVRTLNESDMAVPIYRQVKFHWQGNPLDGTVLNLTGAGLREKKVVLVNVNVYIAESYSDLKEPLKTTNPLESLGKAKIKALKLTFLRDLEAEKIRDSFSDALKVNGVSTDSPAMKKIFTQLSFDVKKGQTIRLVGFDSEKGMETVAFELDKDLMISEGKGLSQDFWKIWFGTPADSGLERLKALLTAPK